MTARTLIDDCFVTDKARMRHDEATTLIDLRLNAVTDSEEIALDEAVGRILATPITAAIPVPMHDNAAVDGFAFAHQDYEALGGKLPVSARIQAGDVDLKPLQTGTAARIFTGAAMPQHADTVVMQEDCELAGDNVHIPSGLKKGANFRRAGEDTKIGDLIFKKGRLLDAADIARLASLGHRSVACRRKLRIAIASTGNELVQPGGALRVGQVFDSNRPLIKVLLQKLPVEITDLGIIEDTKAVVETTLKDASSNHDMLITSGGVSRGQEDHMVGALDKLGKRHLWQLAVKPGRPMTFGQIKDCIYLGLPGNPVAVFVCFLLYARRAILIRAGANYKEPVRFPLPANFEMRKKPDRREFLRGILARDNNGQLVASKYQRDGSGLISSLTEADGLIEIPEETTHIAPGDRVNFIPMSELT